MASRSTRPSDGRTVRHSASPPRSVHGAPACRRGSATAARRRSRSPARRPGRPPAWRRRAAWRRARRPSRRAAPARRRARSESTIAGNGATVSHTGASAPSGERGQPVERRARPARRTRPARGGPSPIAAHAAASSVLQTTAAARRRRRGRRGDASRRTVGVRSSSSITLRRTRNAAPMSTTAASTAPIRLAVTSARQLSHGLVEALELEHEVVDVVGEAIGVAGADADLGGPGHELVEPGLGEAQAGRRCSPTAPSRRSALASWLSTDATAASRFSVGAAAACDPQRVEARAQAGRVEAADRGVDLVAALGDRPPLLAARRRGGRRCPAGGRAADRAWWRGRSRSAGASSAGRPGRSAATVRRP